MAQMGKMIALLGLAMLVVGGLMWLLGRAGGAGFRGLPGDIRWESGNVRVYVPIVSAIVISLVLTIILNLVLWLMRR